jgi:hypothetical protein
MVPAGSCLPPKLRICVKRFNRHIETGGILIQPRYGEDAYPIGRFILDRARALRLTRTEVVRRLGYRDLGAGHRVLNTILHTGMVPTAFALPNKPRICSRSRRSTFYGCTRSDREPNTRRAARPSACSGGSLQSSVQPHLRTEAARIRPEPHLLRH